MRAQNLQYQHQIEARANEQAPSSSRFRAEIRPMPSLETPAETVTNDIGTIRTPDNNRTEPSQVEQINPPINNVRNFAGTTQAGMNDIPMPTGTHEAELQRRLNEMEDLIRRIPGVPAPIKKSSVNSYADSPFTDNIALVEMPRKFSFPNMKLYDGTTDPDDHIAQYKQRMFTTAIPRDLREACMCKGFGSSLIGPALQWYTNLPNNSICSFAQLTDTFVEQFASSRKPERDSQHLNTI